MADLTTEWAQYLIDLRAATPAIDLTTLVRADEATVRSSVGDGVEDLNTQYLVYLTSA